MNFQPFFLITLTYYTINIVFLSRFVILFVAWKLLNYVCSKDYLIANHSNGKQNRRVTKKRQRIERQHFFPLLSNLQLTIRLFSFFLSFFCFQIKTTLSKNGKNEQQFICTLYEPNRDCRCMCLIGGTVQFVFASDGQSNSTHGMHLALPQNSICKTSSRYVVCSIRLVVDNNFFSRTQFIQSSSFSHSLSVLFFIIYYFCAVKKINKWDGKHQSDNKRKRDGSDNGNDNATIQCARNNIFTIYSFRCCNWYEASLPFMCHIWAFCIGDLNCRNVETVTTLPASSHTISLRIFIVNLCAHLPVWFNRLEQRNETSQWETESRETNWPFIELCDAYRQQHTT